MTTRQSRYGCSVPRSRPKTGRIGPSSHLGITCSTSAAGNRTSRHEGRRALRQREHGDRQLPVPHHHPRATSYSSVQRLVPWPEPADNATKRGLRICVQCRTFRHARCSKWAFCVAPKLASATLQSNAAVRRVRAVLVPKWKAPRETMSDRRRAWSFPRRKAAASQHATTVMNHPQQQQQQVIKATAYSTLQPLLLQQRDTPRTSGRGAPPEKEKERSERQRKATKAETESGCSSGGELCVSRGPSCALGSSDKCRASIWNKLQLLPCVGWSFFSTPSATRPACIYTAVELCIRGGRLSRRTSFDGIDMRRNPGAWALQDIFSPRSTIRDPPPCIRRGRSFHVFYRMICHLLRRWDLTVLLLGHLLVPVTRCDQPAIAMQYAGTVRSSFTRESGF